MDRDLAEKFRQRLQALRAELAGLEDTLEEAGKTVELDQARVGRLSRMDALQGQQMALESARRRRQQLSAIDAALVRLDEGEYGYCESCGENIDPRRLEVDPAQRLCINCAEKEEPR